MDNIDNWIKDAIGYVESYNIEVSDNYPEEHLEDTVLKDLLYDHFVKINRLLALYYALSEYIVLSDSLVLAIADYLVNWSSKLNTSCESSRHESCLSSFLLYNSKVGFYSTTPVLITCIEFGLASPHLSTSNITLDYTFEMIEIIDYYPNNKIISYLKHFYYYEGEWFGAQEARRVASNCVGLLLDKYHKE